MCRRPNLGLDTEGGAHVHSFAASYDAEARYHHALADFLAEIMVHQMEEELASGQVSDHHYMHTYQIYHFSSLCKYRSSRCSSRNHPFFFVAIARW